jgi:hypothetical protein
MACPNFKKGLKMAFGPLGVKHWAITLVFNGNQSLTQIVNSCFLEYFSEY